MAMSDFNNLCSEFPKAVNADDLDAVSGFYAPEAVFVTGPGTAESVAGSAAIREVLAGFLATHPVMEFEHTYLFVSGDAALARGKWKLTSTWPTGAAESIAGSSIEVLKRQADGSWRYVIDHPWGGDCDTIEIGDVPDFPASKGAAARPSRNGSARTAAAS